MAKQLTKPTSSTAQIDSPDKATQTHTVLGADTAIEGVLTSRGHVQLDGTFSGNITALGNVIIEKEALLKGDLIAQTVTVAGVVRGDITARKITLKQSGRIIGDLRQEALFTEEGSFFQGMMTMEEALDIATLIDDKSQTTGEIIEEALKEVEEKKKTTSPT